MRTLKQSIRFRFLRQIVPSFLVTTVLLLALLALFERDKAREVNFKLAQQKTEHLALLLTEPVWQLSESLAKNILISALEEEDVICVRLEQDSERNPVIEKGSCATPNNEQVEVFHSPIIYTGMMPYQKLGDLYLTVYIHSEWSLIAQQMFNLVMVAIGLFCVIMLISILAFNSTILTPLHRVSASLRHYQATGKREAVDWDTQDELGQLIHEYNNALSHQMETEKALQAARESAESALEHLKQTQNSLIQAEKMASLGSLVAGIAHEVNTPLGNSLTVVTTIADSTRMLEAKINEGALTRSALTEFVENIDEASTILERNLRMAANQVRNFKQVAVDQTSEQRRTFNLKEVLDDILYTLRPQIKRTAFKVQLDAPVDIVMNSYPGPLGQIITNCFNNALLHGFEAKNAGTIVIKAAALSDSRVLIEFSDDGNGMNDSQLKRAFDPFFTTKMGKGGSGLGLNLVYNITTTILGGSVLITSPNHQGVTLSFRLPTSAPEVTRVEESEPYAAQQ